MKRCVITLLAAVAIGLLAMPEAFAETVAGGHDGTLSDAPRQMGNSTFAALLFWMFAGLTVGGAIFVITRRNLVAAVMGLVGTFFAIAALYVMLYAHFLAVIQVLVYAGAIMVLFVFVIMILNRPIEEPWSRQGVLANGVAILATLYMLVRMGQVLWSVEAPTPQSGLAPGPTIDGFDFGSTKALGDTLFGNYLFPFEAVSLVLLVAVVGAIAVARPHAKRESGTEDDVEQEGAS